ncbi:arginine--tRNA ligase, cytoplasmic [Artemisia annua]|uniref:arginine--tRNA ligase n=1 Tax=Artemisia annua TaxID=35608 RepID=A0A2U1L8V4_ARTAN|nr:arginine--tRNA ligase, cytoplasmic [Artemisia annua]
MDSSIAPPKDPYSYIIDRVLFSLSHCSPPLESASKVHAADEEEKFCHSKKKKKDKRWSLQEEIAKLFNTSLEGAFCRWEEGVSCSISPYPNEDGDYLCTSVLHVWPEIRKTHMYRGPTDAGLGVRENIMDFDYSDMIKRCVVCGPGFVKFKLSRKWIAKLKMMTEFPDGEVKDEDIGELEGNTVLYLRYTHAQICSVINKHRSGIKKLKKLKVEKVEELVLKNDEESLLGLHILRFTEVLGEVCTTLMPHILCEYLFDLCNKFNSYHSSVHEVVEYGDEKSKLLLCEATAVVMKKCFHLLGITPICKKIESETTTSAAKVPDEEEKIESSKYGLRSIESQATSAAKEPGFLFELHNVVLRHNIDARVENGSSYNELRLFGTIQAETHNSDPSCYGSLDIFNRNFDDPLVITKPGSLSPHDIQYCSLTASTFAKITVKLYGTTYKGDEEMESISDYTKYYLATGIPREKLYGGISRKIDPDKVRKCFAEYYDKGMELKTMKSVARALRISSSTFLQTTRSSRVTTDEPDSSRGSQCFQQKLARSTYNSKSVGYGKRKKGSTPGPLVKKSKQTTRFVVGFEGKQGSTTYTKYLYSTVKIISFKSNPDVRLQGRSCSYLDSFRHLM